MLFWLLAFFLTPAPVPATGGMPQAVAIPLPFEVRTNANLLFGKGQKTGAEYYDTIVTGQPSSGVLIKLPYTSKGGRFSFDLHHRIVLSEEFGYPAEVTTEVQVLTGGTGSLGTYTISSTVNSGDGGSEEISRTSKADVDRYVTPIGVKSVALSTLPGPQSISIVARAVTITRGTRTTRIDTPGARLAMVSNFKFEDVSLVNPLSPPAPR